MVSCDFTLTIFVLSFSDLSLHIITLIISALNLEMNVELIRLESENFKKRKNLRNE